MADERESLNRLLKSVAPGTALREGLDNVLKAQTGGLIVLGDSPQVLSLVDGGFRIDAEFTPASLYELAKMDGAIILSHDARRILFANAQLVPDAAMASGETGIRHRTAERTARQTGELVIAISQRRRVISLYKGNLKYVLRDLTVILTKANQGLETLERYLQVWRQALQNLSALELEEQVTALDVVTAVQRWHLLLRIEGELQRSIAELGVEGRLVSLQLEEVTAGVMEAGRLVLLDYLRSEEGRTPEQIRDLLLDCSPDELVEPAQVCRLLGLGTGTSALDQPVSPRGYRVLRKLPRLPAGVVENIVEHFGSLQPMLRADIEELDEVDGVGEVRARSIRDGLRRLREQVLLERR